MKIENYNLSLIDIKPLNEDGIVEIELVSTINLSRFNNQKPANSAEKKAPADVTSKMLMNSVGAAHSAFPDNHLKYSLSQPILKSSKNVDNQKSRHSEIIGSVDDTGFAPVDSQVVSRGRHYTSPTVNTNYQTNERLSSELAALLDNDFDYQTELVNIGARVHNEPNVGRSRHKPIVKKGNTIQDIYEKILPEINQGRFRPASYPEVQLPSLINKRVYEVESRIEMEVEPPIGGSTSKTTRKSDFHNARKFMIVFIFAGLIFGIWKLGVKLKNNIVESGNSAIVNLEQAETNLGGFEISKALVNFSNAYDDFSKTGDNLNFMGSYLGELIAQIPGNNQYKSARNLVEAGKLFSRAGEFVASALNSVSKANVILNPNDSGANLVTNLKRAALLSQADIHKASSLLADIDLAIIPEEKKDAFAEFNKKMPEILKIVDEGAEYIRFLENLIAINTTQKYLVLFQNPSELRPTGGFPGSYGVLSFKNGKLDEFKVDDMYNLDGQLEENIIPPKELQHITPTWGMRDSNWFIDFPTSARKIMEFFRKEADYGIDGVITFSPVIVEKILDIVGPIELPEYNLTLDSSNFIQEIQAEVEYGSNRTQPKTILSNFAPKLLEKIYGASPADWMKIFKVLIKSPENKDMLLYFKDLNLQSFVMEKGFGGDVKSVESDYLMPTVTNIKGSKTDAVTDNFIKLYTSFEGDYTKHKLVITRKHNGGSEKYGFYNRSNPAYLRVLVPESAEFVNIDGNDKPSYKPLIDYDNPEFSSDDDLSRFEALKTKNEAGVTESYESGKKSYGFWLVVKPGETKSVKLSYQIPIKDAKTYNLYIQKQPGLKINDFEIVFNDSINIVSGQQTGKMETDIIIKAVLQ